MDRFHFRYTSINLYRKMYLTLLLFCPISSSRLYLFSPYIQSWTTFWISGFSGSTNRKAVILVPPCLNSSRSTLCKSWKEFRLIVKWALLSSVTRPVLEFYVSYVARNIIRSLFLFMVHDITDGQYRYIYAMDFTGIIILRLIFKKSHY